MQTSNMEVSVVFSTVPEVVDMLEEFYYQKILLEVFYHY